MRPPRRLDHPIRRSEVTVIHGLPKDKVQSRLLLDVVVAEGAAVLELLSGEDEALLVGRNAGWL